MQFGLTFSESITLYYFLLFIVFYFICPFSVGATLYLGLEQKGACGLFCSVLVSLVLVPLVPALVKATSISLLAGAQ